MKTRTARMLRVFKNPKVRASAYVSAGALVISCSGRVVTSSDSGTPDVLSAVQARGQGNVTLSVIGSSSIALLSLPPDETTLETFSTALEASGATHFQAAVLDGKDTPCANFGPVKPVKELLTVQLGKAGDKTLCVQAANEKGDVGKIAQYSFKKRAPSADGPEIGISALPKGYLYSTQSSSQFTIQSEDAVQYRAAFVATSNLTSTCRTLENRPWVDIDQPLNLRHSYDGAWQLCVEVRDKNGKKSLAPRAYSWIRDTVYPVVNSVPVPEGKTTESKFSFAVSGNLVDHYQYALVEGSNNCSGVTYSALAPVSTPLDLQVSKDGVWTFCLMTESRTGLRQQAPFIKTFEKVSPIVSKPPDTPPTENPSTPSQVNPVAVVSIDAVPVNASLVPRSTSRSFTISGNGVTHYKSFTSDSSTTCPSTVPSGEAVPVSTKLTRSFANTGIKTVCVWGIQRAASGAETTQPIATWFRFHNSTTYSTIGKSIANATPYTRFEAYQACSCHTYIYDADWRDDAVRISNRLRANTMPPTGWSGKDTEKARMMGYLSALPGYPVDMPYVISP